MFQEYGTTIITILIRVGLAFIPATIAKNKGRNMGAWWVYGFFLWLIALIHSLVMQDTRYAQYECRQCYTESPKAPPTPMPTTASVNKTASNEIAYFDSRDVDSITCPYCGKIQKPDRDFCFSCRSRFEYGVPESEQIKPAPVADSRAVSAPVLETDAPVAVEEAIAPEPVAGKARPKFCRKCGNPLVLADSLFCDMCGAKIITAEETHT